MLPFIDNFIQRTLTKYLRNRREKVVNKAIKDYCATHNLDKQAVDELTEQVNYEVNRAYAIADDSVIRARIHQARYAFWITSILATSVILAMTVFPVTTPIMPFFAPLIASFIAWMIYIVTIPVNYNGRVQGGINSAFVSFEKMQSERAQRNAAKLAMAEVLGLQNDLVKMKQQMAGLRKQIKSSRPVVAGVTLWHVTDDKSEIFHQKEIELQKSLENHKKLGNK